MLIRLAASNLYLLICFFIFTSRPSAVGQVCLTADLVNSIYLQQLTEQYVMSTAPLVVMSENSYPLLTYQLTSGSEVIVFGNMKFQR